METNAIYTKTLIKKIVRATENQDLNFAFDDLKENLNFELSTKTGILFIKNYNSEFLNIFGNNKYGYIQLQDLEAFQTNDIFNKLKESNSDLYEQIAHEEYELYRNFKNELFDLEHYDELINAEIKKILNTIGITEIKATGYSQSDYDNYYFYFDSLIISEQNIQESFETLKYIFTISELYITLINQFKIQVIDHEGNILIDQTEEEEEEEGNTMILYGNEKSQEIANQIKKQYEGANVVFEGEIF